MSSKWIRANTTTLLKENTGEQAARDWIRQRFLRYDTGGKVAKGKK